MNRVWIYTSAKPFSAETEALLQEELRLFTQKWNAHGTALTSVYEILHHHFIVIKADEQKFSASGCSIDTQLRFIKELETKYQLVLLDRLQVAYTKEQEVRVVHASKIPQMLQENTINENTMVFNTSVSDEDAYKKYFEIPLKESWLYKQKA
ncbi:MAG: ABC transporter ATPase [Bacteroidetes bacterium]|nr:ABC transporter ATPase [Bacteroidota bacterium]